MEPPTLASKIGTTSHLSPLLHKAKRLGLDSEGLQRLAIQRGCDYYHDGSPLPPAPVSIDHFSNAELAMALLNPALRYDPQTLRLGAAMLSAETNCPEEIARLAIMERCVPIIRYIAEAGKKFEPDNPFWVKLLELLPAGSQPRSGVMPHPSRFVTLTGFSRRGVGTLVQWIRPTPVHG